METVTGGLRGALGRDVAAADGTVGDLGLL
jgi:hypothetical protein